MASYAAQAGGMGLGAFGALAQGQQTSQLLDYQAQVQTNNANEALASAKFNADRQQVAANHIIGQISAGAGASGVSGDSGSILSVVGASAANAELDRQNILHGGEMRAVNYENQASLDRLGAQHATQASYFNALSSLVGGAASMSYGFGGGGTTGGPSDAGGSPDMTTTPMMMDSDNDGRFNVTKDYGNGYYWFGDGFFGTSPRGTA